VTESEKLNEAISYWMRMSQESLDSAEDEFKADRLSFATNRAYYACFYAASAVLLSKGKEFSKHSGIRAALHQHLVKTGEIPVEFGRVYDKLFEDRQEGDYIGFAKFEREQVIKSIDDAKLFVATIRKLLE
jgi:uncharacterized protein (UPF0332 family)